jgi:hypothetical protein
MVNISGGRGANPFWIYDLRFTICDLRALAVARANRGSLKCKRRLGARGARLEEGTAVRTR